MHCFPGPLLTPLETSSACSGTRGREEGVAVEPRVRRCPLAARRPSRCLSNRSVCQIGQGHSFHRGFQLYPRGLRPCRVRSCILSKLPRDPDSVGPQTPVPGLLCEAGKPPLPGKVCVGGPWGWGAGGPGRPSLPWQPLGLVSSSTVFSARTEWEDSWLNTEKVGLPSRDAESHLY